MLLALLVPAWLCGEWEVRTEGMSVSSRLIVEGSLLLAITYLGARGTSADSTSEGGDLPARRALAWIGGILLLPLAILAFVERREFWGWWTNRPHASSLVLATGWLIAIGGAPGVILVVPQHP